MSSEQKKRGSLKRKKRRRSRSRRREVSITIKNKIIDVEFGFV
jgi:hypothetical protein